MTISHAATLRIASANDLMLLWRESRSGRRRIAGRIELAFGSLAEPDRAAAEERINKAYFACGCGGAAIGALVGLAAFIVWATAIGEASMWLDAILGVLVFFVGGGIGKSVARRRANATLRREVEALGAASGTRLASFDTHGVACAVGHGDSAVA